MKDDFFRIDLHIHTPSSKDWKGSNEKDEYVKILRRAKAQELDLIAITDHSSVEGFIKINRTQEETKQLFLLSQNRGDFDSKIMKNLEEEVFLFKSIKILMGIEIKANPGIHYIVIFREKIVPDDVKKYLVNLTNGKITDNWGNPDFMIDKTSSEIFTSLKNTFSDDCLIYAPHVDSTAGLVRELDNFRDQRLIILKDKSLSCVGINKLETRSFIKENLLPNIKKERNFPLHFLNDSDFHGGAGEEVGSGYFILEKTKQRLDFQDLLNRFKKTDDLKLFFDIAHDQYQNFIKNKHIIKLNIGIDKKFEDKTLNDFCENACAILNSDEGFIQFEIYTHGVEDPKTKIDDFIQFFVELLKDRLGYSPSSGTTLVFPISKSKQIVLFKFDKSDKLVLYNDICYTFDVNKNLIKAESHIIESIVAKKIFRRFGEPKDFSIRSIADKANKIKNSLLAFSVAYKNEKILTEFKDYSVEFLQPNKASSEVKKAVDEAHNGLDEGDFSVILSDLLRIKAGRYPESYLRFSLPLFNLSDVDKIDEIPLITKNSILLFPRGGSFLSQHDIRLISELPLYKIDLKNEKVNPYDVIAFLKSSFLQWYLIKVLNHDDIFDYLIKYTEEKLPFLKNLIENKTSIQNIVHNVLLSEKKFLKEYNKIDNDRKDESLKLIEKHNYDCTTQMIEIDKAIFSLLDISKREIKQIYKDLKEINIFDYKVLENFDNLYS